MNSKVARVRESCTAHGVRVRHLLCLLAAMCVAGSLVVANSGAIDVSAQTLSPGRGATVARQSKLPSPEKIIGDYLKALGGKKRVAVIRDATYEWLTAESAAEDGERTRRRTKTPAAERTDVPTTGGELSTAASQRSAWMQMPGGFSQTLTGADAQTAKLQAALNASRLVDFKKLNVLARTLSLEQLDGEPAYVVEFSTREGGRLRYWFGASNKLLRQVADDTRRATVRFGDYRVVKSVLEPHRVTQRIEGEEPRTLMLQSVRYNTGLAESIFDPPVSSEIIDVPALLRDVASNQTELDGRVSEYTFTRKQTEREINDRGELKKEKVIVHEVYPVVGGGRVLKLISEGGMPLPPDKATKEEKRVVDELAKAEREYEERQQKRARVKAEREKKKGNETGVGENGDDDLGISAFLRACEFVSPRRERFRDRDAVVFDFRARPGFRPTTRDQSLIVKLAGVVWIDPSDKQVMRLEARLVDGFKIGGGLLASVRSGSNFAFEQARMVDGVWLPRFSQISASAKVFLLAGFKLDATREYSDYKRFSTKTVDAVLDAPLKP
ncbi:MAG: hypothetical protein M3458_15880 [Acidobacteriota bacterium]|nr:hypothetical protein [Acidobacteriota bacterium]